MVAESGLPGFDANRWFGLLAPAGTPMPIVRQINADFAEAKAKDLEQQKRAELDSARSARLPKRVY
jgi:tripartite-type tricarboxylate transporter receptor subunit TctC